MLDLDRLWHAATTETAGYTVKQAVEIRCDDNRWYPATVQKANGTKRVTVLWADGGVATVDNSFVRPAKVKARAPAKPAPTAKSGPGAARALKQVAPVAAQPAKTGPAGTGPTLHPVKYTDLAKAQAVKLSSHERDALNGYAEQSSDINLTLRRGLLKDRNSRREAADVAVLDKIIARAPPLKQPATLFRGIDLDPDDPKDAAHIKTLMNAKPGVAITDKTYLSTSTDQRAAAKFANSGVMIVIHARPGTRCLAMNRDEKEILLARDAKLRVLQAPETRNGVTYIHVEA